MAKNKQSPEHSWLSKPIQRPNNPVVVISSHRSQSKNDTHISYHVAHRPPWILNPTVLGNCCPNIRKLEWGRRCKIKFLITISHIIVFFHLLNPQWGAHIQSPLSLSVKPFWQTEWRLCSCDSEIWGVGIPERLGISWFGVDSWEWPQTTFR